MKVLSVAPWVPWEVRPRSLGLLSLAAERHEVHLLALARGAEEAAHAADLPARAGLAGVRLVGNARVASARRVVRALPGRLPLQCAYADEPALRSALAEELDRLRPDLVHLNVARTAHLLPLLGDHPVVLDLDERRSGYFEQLAGVPADGPTGFGRLAPWSVVGRLEAPRLAALEAAVFRSGVSVLLSSATDVDRADNAHVVPSPLDLDRWTPSPRLDPPAGARSTMCFVGRLHQRANHEAVTWFAEACLPRIPAEVRPVLDIVGEAPPRSVAALAGPGVRVRGFVDDLAPVYAEARMALVPVRTGTGVQMKLIQALAAGVPAITTSACAARARLVPGRDVLVADTPEGWAVAVTRLATDDVLWHQLRRHGAAAVRALHGRPAVAERLAAGYAAARAPWSTPSVARSSTPSSPARTVPAA